MNKRQIIRVLYRKLLSLYPEGFKKQLGESMEQTFNDLYQIRRARGDGQVLSFYGCFLIQLEESSGNICGLLQKEP